MGQKRDIYALMEKKKKVSENTKSETKARDIYTLIEKKKKVLGDAIPEPRIRTISSSNVVPKKEIRENVNAQRRNLGYASPNIAPQKNTIRKSMTQISQRRNIEEDDLLVGSLGKLTPAVHHKIIQAAQEKKEKNKGAKERIQDFLQRKSVNSLQIDSKEKNKRANDYIRIANLDSNNPMTIAQNPKPYIDSKGETRREVGTEFSKGVASSENLSENERFYRNRQKEAKYLTQQERDTYQYLYGMYGKDTAENFYKEHLQEMINYRVAKENYEKEKQYGGVNKIINSISSGIYNNMDGLSNLPQAILRGENTSKRSVNEMMQTIRRMDEENTKATNVALDISQSIGNMLPGMAVGAGVTKLSGNLKLGQIAASATFGTGIGGGAYKQTLREGYEPKKAQLYAAEQAVDEAVTNYLLGGISAFGGGAIPKLLGKTPVGKAVEQAMNTGIQKFIKSNAGKIVANNILEMMGRAGGEATQEFVQNYTDKVSRNIFLGEKNTISLADPDAWYSAFLGAATAGIMDVPGQTIRSVQTRNIGKSVMSNELLEDIKTLDAIIQNHRNEKLIRRAVQTKEKAIQMVEDMSHGLQVSPYERGKVTESIHEVFYDANLEMKKENKELEKQERRARKQETRERALQTNNQERSRDIESRVEEEDSYEEDDNIENTWDENVYEEDNNVDDIQNENFYEEDLYEEDIEHKNRYEENIQTQGYEDIGEDKNTSQVKEKTPEKIPFTERNNLSPNQEEKATEQEKNIEPNILSSPTENSLKRTSEEMEDGIERDSISPNLRTMPTQKELEQMAREKGIRIHTIQEYSKQLGGFGKESYIQNFDKNGSIPIHVYDEGFKIAYMAGRYKGAFRDVKKPALFMLSEKQRNQATLAGIRDRAAAEQFTIKKGEQRKGGLAYTEDEKSKKHNHLLDTVGKYTGLQFALVERLPQDANGAYIKEKGMVYVSMNAENTNATISHELTHFIQDYAPKEYSDFQNIVLNSYMKQTGYRLESEIEKYANRYSGVESVITRDDILDEITADATAYILNDVETIEQLAKSHKGLVTKIIDFLNDMIEALKSFVSDVKNNSIADSIQKDIKQYEAIKKLWIQGLEVASQRYRDGLEVERITKYSGEEKYSVNPSFAQQYDNWVRGNRKKRIRFDFGMTSKSLQKTGLDYRHIYMDSGKILNMLGKHSELTDKVIKQLPQILEHPIVVMESKTRNTAITMFGEVQGTNYKPVMLALELNPVQEQEKPSYYITLSAYTKNGTQKFINSSKIIGLESNKKRTYNWLRQNGLQLPVSATNYSSLDVHSLAQRINNVKKNANGSLFSLKENVDREIIQTKFARYSLSSTLSQDLDKVLSGEMKTYQNELYIGTSSNFITQKIGAKKLKVIMPIKKALSAMVNEEEAKKSPYYDKNYNYHDLGKYGLIKALESAENPVIAFTPYDKNMNVIKGRIALVTDQEDKNHRPIVVFLDVHSIGNISGKSIKANRIITVYDKENIKEQISHAMNTNGLLYVDNKRSQLTMALARVQFPRQALTRIDFNSNIQQFWAEINYKNDSEFRKNIEKNSKKILSSNPFMGITLDGNSKTTKFSLKTVKEMRNSMKIENQSHIEQPQEVILEKFYQELQQQFSKNRQYLPKSREIKEIADEILKETKSNYQKEALYQNLSKLFRYIRTFHGQYVAEVMKVATDLSKDIIVQSETVSTGHEKEYAYVRDEIKKYTLKIGEEEVQGLENRGGLLATQRKFFRKIQLSTHQGTEVDTAYQELEEAYPHLFDSSVQTTYEKLNRILEVVEMLDTKYEHEFTTDIDGLATLYATKIFEKYIDRKENKNREDQEFKKQVQDIRNEIKILYRERDQKQRLRRLEREESNRLLKLARDLKKVKGDEEFERQKNILIGNLDTISKGMRDDTKVNLQNLLKENARLMEEDPYYIPGAAVEKALFRLDSKKIADMSAEDIKELTQAIIELRHGQKIKDRLIREEQEKRVSNTAITLMNQVKDIKPSIANTFKNMKDRALIYQLDPIRAFRFLSNWKENSVLEEFGRELNDGQLRKTKFAMDATRLFDKVLEKREFTDTLNKMDINISNDKKNPVYISKAMRISLYLHSLNYDNMRHILKGGITIPNATLIKKGNISEAYIQGSNTIRLSKHDMERIVGEMTQEEKEFAKATQEYFNGLSKNAINEVSMQMLGHQKANISNYYPIISDARFLKTEWDSIFMDSTFENQRMMKERIHGTNPILLEDVTNRLVREIENTSNLLGFAIPLRNFNKVYNFTTKNYKDSVKSAMGKTWGNLASNYIDKMIGDIQGNNRTNSSFLDRLRGKFAGAVLTANVSVTMQQLSAYPTAAAVIGYKPLAKAFFDGGKNHHIFSSANREEINRYTPLMWYREQGNINRELGDIAKNRQLGVKTRLEDFSSAFLDWVSKTDNAVVGRLWDATKFYVDEKNPNLQKGSEEYFKEVAKVFNRVVEETQSNYTIMQRSGVLRETNQTVKALTMFYTQRSQNFGLMFDAWGNLHTRVEEYKKNPTLENRKKLYEAKTIYHHTISSQILSAVMGAAGKFIGTVLLFKVKKYKDKEGNITPLSVFLGILEDTMGSLIGNFLGGTELYNMLIATIEKRKPFAIESPGISTVNGILQMIPVFTNDVFDYLNAEDKKTAMKKMKASGSKLAWSISQATSLPTKNLYDIVNGAIKHISNIVNEKGLDFYEEGDVVKKEYFDIIFDKLYKKGDWNGFIKSYNQSTVRFGKEETSTEIVKRLQDTDEVKRAAKALLDGNQTEVKQAKKELKEKLKESSLLTDHIDKSIENEYGDMRKEIRNEQEDVKEDNEKEAKYSQKAEEWMESGFDYMDYIKYREEMESFKSDRDKDGKEIKKRKQKIIEYLKSSDMPEKAKRLLWSFEYTTPYLELK